MTPAASGIPTASERGAKSEVAHFWARWLRNPCRLGDPNRFRAGDKIRSGPLVGQGGYVTSAASRIPTASERGAKSEVAHLFLLPALKLRGSPRRHWSRSHLAHKWATSDFVPRFEADGNPEAAGVT